MAKELVDIDVDSTDHETADAWKVTIDEDEHWLPKSQCEQNSPTNYTVPEWLAIEKGLV